MTAYSPTKNIRTAVHPYSFTENDVFRNVLKTYPKYIFSFHLNAAHINRRVSEGHNVITGAVSLYEMDVDRLTANAVPGDEGFNDYLISGSFTKGENKVDDVAYKSVKFSQLGAKLVPAGTDMSIPYPLTASIARELIKAKPDTSGDADTDNDGYLIYSGSTSSKTVRKVVALKNTFDYYKYLSPYYDFDTYILKNGGIPPHSLAQYGKNINVGGVKPQAHPLTQSIPVNDLTNLIVIPKIFYGNKIKKGSIDLKFYYTGSLLARAQDIRKNGELVETYRGNEAATGSVIGMALYNEGVLLITASYNLDDNLVDGYMSPTGSHADGVASWMVDNPKWGYFGAYKSFVISPTEGDAHYGPTSSSYSLEFQGTEKIPVITMLAHAKKNDLNWSNNPTFLDRKDEWANTNNLATDWHYTRVHGVTSGSSYYKENKYISIHNTISSSYDNYSASYAPQTFISKIGIFDKDKNLIGIAKVANPVKKTEDRELTFKLKLDF